MNKSILSFCVMVLVCGCKPSKYNDPVFPESMETTIKTIDPMILEPKPDVNTPQEPEPNTPPPKTMTITLEQCRAMALENNLELRAQLIAPTLSEESLNQERAKFEAAFSSNIRYSKNDNPTRSGLESNQSDNLNIGTSLDFPLVTGGTATFDTSDSRNHSDSLWSTFDPTYSPGVTFSLSQPLLQGAGAKSTLYSIRIAGLNYARTRAQTKLEVIRIVAAMDRVYWRLYAARKALDVRNQQLELAQAQLEQAQRQVQAGTSAQVEIIRAQAGVAQQAEAIIIAKNDLADRQRELKRVLNQSGLTMRSRTEMIPETDAVPEAYQLDPNQLLASASEHRMELLEMELQLLQDDHIIDYLKNQSLPVATMDYSYNINGLGQTRNSAYDLLRENRYANHALGLSLRIPLGNEAAKSRIRSAKYEKIQRLITKKNRESVIEYEVLNALDQVETNWQRIIASQHNTILNSNVYEAEKRQFEQGLRTSTDVLDAQTTLANAQLSELSALVEYQISLVDLAYATGTLLGAAQIEWEPVVPVIE